MGSGKSTKTQQQRGKRQVTGAGMISSPEVQARLESSSGKTGAWPGLLRLISAGTALPLLLAIVVTFFILTFPRVPIGSELDSSWAAVLTYAHQHGLQFGKDIAFTYGPLGFLIMGYFSGHAVWARMLTDVLLCFGIAAGFCLVAWRMKLVGRISMLAILLFLAPNIETRTDLLIYIGFFCWGLLCFVESGPRLAIYAGGFTALAIFSALAKLTFFFLGIVSLALIAADLFLRGRNRLALAMLLGFAGGIALGWVLLGQDLRNFSDFVINALVISREYSQVMSWEAVPVLLTRGIIVASAACAMIVLRAATADSSGEQGGRVNPVRGQVRPRSLYVRRALLLTWLGTLLLITWKHAFVRAGYEHMQVFLGSIPILAIALDVIPTSHLRARWFARALAVVCCYLSVTAVEWMLPGKLGFSLPRPFQVFARNFNAVFDPVGYQRQMSQVLDMAKAGSQLPRLRQIIGPASVDVFGHDQRYAFFNDLNYRPRPVFQSYAAYSPHLAQLNQRRYLSDARPDYVLFRLKPIDDRLPALEDALLFRDLLVNYEPVAVEEVFLLLKHRQAISPSLTLVHEGTIRPGELMDLRPYEGEDLWMQVELKPSLRGKLRQFFYQSQRARLAVWRHAADPQPVRFSAPASMLGGGFVASPLAIDNEDVLELYTGNAVHRPAGYSVELPLGTEALWNPSVRYRIYKIVPQLGRNSSTELGRLLKYPGFDAAPSEVVTSTNAFMRIEGKPVLLLPPGAHMRFTMPAGSKAVRGVFGFQTAAYLSVLGGNTGGAEFRVEQQMPDGTIQLLYSQTLRPRTNPADRGLKRFRITVPGEGERRLVFRAVPAAPGEGNPACDLTCWGEIGFD